MSQGQRRQLLIQFSHISHFFGSYCIFNAISLSIHQGEVFAIVGKNGSGKTTLLHLIRGYIPPTSGLFYKEPHIRIGFLPQEILLSSSNITPRTYIENELLTALEEKMALCLDEPDRLADWEALHIQYEQLGGYQKIPLEKILDGLDIDVSLLDRPMNSLSSGQRVRIGLAKALIENPDLLLLDEPTNHLDRKVIEWLTKAISQRKGATIIVSHDRGFLNDVSNRVVEIDKNRISFYGGNYNFYLSEKERSLQQQIKAYEIQQEEIAYIRQKIKAATFSKEKASPPEDRNFMSYGTKKGKYQKSLQRNIDGLKTKLSQLETALIDSPRPKNIKGAWFDKRPLHSPIAVELEGVCKSFGENVLFSNLDITILSGERMIVRGPNGSGKTTFLQCLAGFLPIDSGKIRYPTSAKISYLDQEVRRVPMDQTPLEYFERRFSISEEGIRREFDKAAIGEYELVQRPFSSLSVGERKRFMLLSLILEQPNILLLDEPTNYLDLMTIEALERALINFEGTVVAISHDKVFTKKIATLEIEISSFIL